MLTETDLNRLRALGATSAGAINTTAISFNSGAMKSIVGNGASGANLSTALRERNTYDGYGRKLTNTEYKVDGTALANHTYSYRSDGQMVEQRDYAGAATTLTSKLIFNDAGMRDAAGNGVTAILFAAAEGTLALAGGPLLRSARGVGGGVPNTAAVSAGATSNAAMATMERRLQRLGYDGENSSRLLRSIENGEQVLIVGENMKRVSAVSRMVEEAGGIPVTYSPRNFRSVQGIPNPLDLKANQSWVRYWAFDKGAPVIDIGRQLTPRPFGPSPFYGIENRSLNRWGIYTPFQ